MSCANAQGACGWESSLWLCALKLLAGPFLTGRDLAWRDFLYVQRPSQREVLVPGHGLRQKNCFRLMYMFPALSRCLRAHTLKTAI
jgi:hypothetical protein